MSSNAPAVRTRRTLGVYAPHPAQHVDTFKKVRQSLGTQDRIGLP